MTLTQPPIEQLQPTEWERLKAVRLRALQDSPHAYATKVSDAVTWPPEVWCQQLEQMTTFVAVQSHESTRLGSTRDVGLVRCVLHSEAETASLVSLWVAPEARGKGVATALIDTVTHFARNNRMGRVVLDVVATNAPAIALYRKLGFLPNGERSVFAESCRGMSEVQFELLL